MFSWFKKNVPVPVPAGANARIVGTDTLVTCLNCGETFSLACGCGSKTFGLLTGAHPVAECTACYAWACGYGRRKYTCPKCRGNVFVDQVDIAASTPAIIDKSRTSTRESISADDDDTAAIRSGDTLLIDGANVMRSYDEGRVSLAVLLTIILVLLKRGVSFFCIFDANTRYVIRESESAGDEQAYARLLKELPKHFAEATGGISADEFLLVRADKRDACILTNDRFTSSKGDYSSRFPWVTSARERLIKGKLMGDEVTIPSLRIDVPVRSNVPEMYDELVTALSAGRDKGNMDIQN